MSHKNLIPGDITSKIYLVILHDHRHRNTRAHHSCASESALAPSQVSHNVQTVCTYASGAYRPCPAYLSDMVTATAVLSSRGRLRSSNTFRYELPLLKRKFGERSFSYAGPKAWNDLPFALQELTDTYTFKRQLKTHLFTLAYTNCRT